MENESGVIVCVLKFHECILFYRDKIGLEILMEKPGIIRFKLGSMYLQIENCKVFEANPTTNVILRENVSSFSRKRNELFKNGIELEIHDLEWGEIGFVHDPHGNKLEYFREK